MPRKSSFLFAGTAVALLLASPASAAYDPRLALELEPPTARSPVALTLTVTQAASEEATRSLHLSLPGFASAPGAGARPPCTDVAATSGTCPAESRIGTASSSTSFGSFAGGVFFAGTEGDTVKVLVVLSNPQVPLVLDQRFGGALSSAAGGSELAFEELPGATATRLQIALDGGERALVSAPPRCGPYDLVGRLTSHRGDRAARSARVAVGGCPGDPPTIATPRLFPRAVREGAVSTLTFSLAEAAAVRVTARQVGTRRVRTLRAADADGASARTLLLRVLRRR